MERAVSAAEVARDLIERWSAKDADAVAEVLAEGASVSGPMVPGGRIEGAAAVRAYLAAQNGDISHLPAEDRARHRAMASSAARIDRVIESADAAAVEVTLQRPDGEGIAAAVFVEHRPGIGITTVAIYFKALPVP